MGPGLGHQRTPALASPSDGNATVAYRWDALDSPDPLPPGLFATTFEPWGPWPLGPLTPPHLVAPHGGASFAVARGQATPLVFAFENLPSPPGGLTYTEAFPNVDNPSPFAVDATDDRVQFLTGGTIGLLGYEWGGGQPGVQFDLAATLVKELPEGPFFQGSMQLGCATTPIVADAFASDQGFVIALANGLPLATLGCTSSGPATQLQLGKVSLTGTVSPGGTLGTLLPIGNESAAIQWVRAAPRAGGGAWVLWYGALSHGEDPPAPGLQLTAFDTTLQPAQTVTINGTVANPTGDAPYPNNFAIVRGGTHLVIAWLNDPSPGADLQPELVVEILDGSAKAVDVLKVPTLGAVNAPLSLLPSPQGDAALLAWSVSEGDAKSPDRVRVARICIPP